MRKITTSLVSVLLLACLFISTCYADQADSILFRNIEWYSHESDVSTAIKKISGVKTPWYGASYTKTKIDGWFKKWPYMHTDEAVDDAGVILHFNHVPVAGYSADLALSFMYPITNGKIDYRTETSEFYMAIYSIDGFDDLHLVYQDLMTKLSEAYGSHVDQSYFPGGMEGVQWTAKDGSLIWLRIRQNTVYKNYEDVQITYFAPNGLQRLKQLSDQIFKEASEKENDRIKQNADNFEGL